MDPEVKVWATLLTIVIACSATLGAIHPIAAQTVLFMILGSATIAGLMLLWIDWMDRKN